MSKDNTNSTKKRELFFTFHHNKETETTYVSFDLPLSFSFGNALSGNELYKQLSEHFKISISTLAQFISVESVEMMMQYSDNDLQVQNTAATFQLLAEYIDAYTTLFEFLERDRKEILAISSDASEVSENAHTLAAQISSIMNNPDLPENLFKVIAYEITDKPLAETYTPKTYTPESVLISLQNLRDQ